MHVRCINARVALLEGRSDSEGEDPNGAVEHGGGRREERGRKARGRPGLAARGLVAEYEALVARRGEEAARVVEAVARD
eukprot:CAMPEP_0206022232 /NCGR_PEP_ID=MMETSP1464-20131121/34296_1 /ASSEMBLY_ACC=CAM_ASM_001124 /TAXON_ID=119497 /ORGANISM="Exanthemachrysis gayraliae, Strain RCC1523" /LENGTH=78 /DNA_ID=CAMNT_0053396193 /DNA_START=84 /DNA_END=317 /DNA_ORIENTATION=-